MPRAVSSNLAAIFALPSRDIEYLLDIVFPSIAALRVSTGELTRGLFNYSNDIEQVAEIRQTIEKPIDNAEITLSNKRLIYDAHFYDNFAEWTGAEAVLYRRYFNADHTLFEDIEVFRGGIDRAGADDAGYTFNLLIVPDTISKGKIVANRTLNPPCGFVFKDPPTCGYQGIETICDHRLKSDCSRYHNTHHFGGTEHFYTLKPAAPGGAGNEAGGGVLNNCPALDQYVLAVTGEGEIFAKSVRFVKKGDTLFNPLTFEAERVKEAEIIENQKLLVVVCANGAGVKCTPSHPLIQSAGDKKGTPAGKLRAGARVLTCNKTVTEPSLITKIEAGAAGSVMRIETAGNGHVYASGASGGRMIIAHNSKNILFDLQ